MKGNDISVVVDHLAKQTKFTDCRQMGLYKEPKSERPHLMRKLGTGYDLDPIFVDIGTKDMRFKSATSWDMYDGLRVWKDPSALVNEINTFSHVVTYNGDEFDLPILARSGLSGARSIDLYQNIKKSVPFVPEKGDLTLGTVSLATNAVLKWNTNEGYGKRCYSPANDTYLTRELFFHVLENGYVGCFTKNEYGAPDQVRKVSVRI